MVQSNPPSTCRQCVSLLQVFGLLAHGTVFDESERDPECQFYAELLLYGPNPYWILRKRRENHLKVLSIYYFLPLTNFQN